MSNTRKTIIVTGASSGIGKAITKKLVEEGQNVVIAARREENLLELAKNLYGSKGSIAIKVTDVTIKQELQELSDFTLQKFGRIDVFINNAGYMEQSFLHKGDIEGWEKMIDINIKGPLYGIATVLPIMRTQGSGQIINISSVLGHTVGPANAVYSGTKHAIRAITEGLRQEEAADKTNIRVTSISPGMIQSELIENITDRDIRPAIFERADQIAIDPVSIANAVSFAINQPEEFTVNELVLRPTVED